MRRQFIPRTRGDKYLWSIAVLLLIGLGSIPGEAEIYKYVKDGVVHYSNRPPETKTYTTFQNSSLSSTPASKRVIKDAPLSSSVTAVPYHTIIQKVAKAYQLNPELVKAVIKVESNYNPRAVSPKGARGLMQLMPATAKRFGVTDIFDPEDNITGGAKFLRYLLDEFGENNLELVLAGYNAGEEAVRKYDNEIPPYADTQQYVKQVLALYGPGAQYHHTRGATIFRYVNQDGVLTFTNVPKVK